MKTIERQYNNEMVILARESRGLSQSSLAKEVGLSQGNISKIEQGFIELTDDVVLKLSQVLSYPVVFFKDSIQSIPVNHQFHRKRKKISKKALSVIDSNLTIRRLHIRQLLSSIEVNHDVPRLDIKSHGDPVTIAKKLRLYWKIPKGPVKNLTGLLESKGVILIKTKINEHLDGMALPDDQDTPIIFLNSSKPIDRRRFTLSHELGHIVMHTGYIPRLDDDVELESDKFAAEFLMPADEFKAMTRGKHISIEELSWLKKYWRCSMASIVYRLNSLDIITPQRYRSLYVQLSKLGYRKHEPDMNIPEEEPRLLNNFIEIYLSDLDYSNSDLAELLRLTKKEFINIYSEPGLKMVFSKKI